MQYMQKILFTIFLYLSQTHVGWTESVNLSNSSEQKSVPLQNNAVS